MLSSFFAEILNPRFDSPVNVDVSKGGKVLIIGDFHMGVGRQDDLAHNGAMLIEILENYYFKNDWTLILNGDIEELQKFRMNKIQEQWTGLYRVFDRFNAANRLYKTLGNHDETLVFERDYPYPLYSAVKINTGRIPIYVFHGHQSSRVYSRFNRLLSLSVRYFLKPLGIRNISSGRSPHRRFYVEKQAYDFSLENNCISIIGHTHRTLFESLGRFDYIKFEIERLCRDYAAASEAEKGRIADEVSNLRVELSKLKRSERRGALRQSLYGDDLPVPCLFNAGCAIGRHGVNAIELDNTGQNRGVSLVYWFIEGRQMKFVNRGWYKVESFKDTSYRRVVLNSDALDYIGAKVELLGR
ncbi:MAG: metallophosphoesterase [Treponema sp.]|jgi:predicted phosphodiesterase|nr:metallophosphoesterase [Treponema sp.]